MAKRVWESLGKIAMKEGKEIAKSFAGRMKDNIDYKMFMYKKKISMQIWETVFLVFGFVLLVVGVMKYLEKFLPEEGVFILFGLLFLLVGWIFSKNLDNVKK